MRYMHCVRCGKKLYENKKCVRHKHFTGFFCSYKCLVNELGIAEESIVTNEQVQEDKEANNIDWEVE